MTSSTLEDIQRESQEKFDELESRFNEQTQELEAAKAAKDDDRIAEVSKSLGEIDEQVKELTAARDEQLKQAEYESLQGDVVQLKKALEDARKPDGDFSISGDVEKAADAFEGTSFYAEARKAIQNQDASSLERWTESMSDKAMTEGSGTTGGYLVPPQIEQQLIELREQTNVLRPLFSKINVNSDTLRIAAQTSGLSAGWVAELAEKPTSELGFGEISVNVFTKAGMAIVSNQLLQDSNPSIDGLINRDLAKRLAALEEIAFIQGTGTNQPKGILHTEGVQLITYDDGSPTYAELIDKIIDAITAIYTNYYGAPNAILMHPRTWGGIVKLRDPVYAAQFYAPVGRDVTDRLPGFGPSTDGNPTGSLFGLPVYTTRNIPVNAGDADNESRIIVGAFDEGLILDHSSVTLDSSPHVYFTSNQTIFRAEDRVGFTAARYPQAFAVVGGTGLAGL